VVPVASLAVPSNVGVAAFAPAIVALDPSALDTISAAASTTPLTPASLSIPALNISAKVEEVGVKENGAMANPSGFSTTGWYKFGARPGEAGNAVIAGHVNNGVGLSGVFARLGELSIGARISVADVSGRTLNYVVIQKARYDTRNAPLEEIFTIQGPSQLVLITCEGDWDPVSRSYDKRLVVVARLVN
jgi:LPXTG-site transpeptidase (sortase) family protein